MRTSLVSRLGTLLLLSVRPFVQVQAEDWRVERPDRCQTDERFGELPLGGEYHCVPTSISNHLIGLSKQFPNLIPSKDPTPKDQVELIRKLSSSDYMNTDSEGTYLSGLIKGLKKYVEECGYNIYFEYKGKAKGEKGKENIREYFTGEEITPEWVKEELKDGANLILVVNFYKNENDNLRFIGGHGVTVVGFNDNNESKFKLHIHDPATRSGIEPETETCNLIFHSDSEIEIEEIKLRKGSDIAFLKYVLAFKIEEPEGG